MDYFIRGFSDIYDALQADPAVFWFLVPIILLWIAMELYFSEYRRDPLGWNSMLGNGVSLVWITVASLRVLQGGGIRFWLLIAFLVYGAVLMIVAFRHSIPQRYTYLLAGPSTLYALATLSVLWGQAGIALTGPPLVAVALSLAALIVIFQVLRHTVFGTRGEVEAIREGRDPEGPREQG